MDTTTINRYQVGGDLYAQYQKLYGTNGANAIAAAAKTGDNSGEVAAAIAQAKNGAFLDSSTLDALGNQLATNPLGAPLASLNNLAGNTLLSLLKSPWVLVIVAGVVFYALGGFGWLGRKLFSEK